MKTKHSGIYYIYMWVALMLLGVFPQSAFAFQDGKALESEKTTVEQPPLQLDEASKGGSTSATCENGTAAGFPCAQVNLISMLSLEELGAPPGIGLNDGWGWEDPDTARRYALVGREDGTAFVDITNPASPVYVGQLPKTPTAKNNVWRDIKVDGYYGFVVADGSGGDHGMQVLDLRKLRDFQGTPLTLSPDALYTGFSVAHNIAINEETHRAYIVGARGVGQSCGGGLHIVDISNPLEPSFLGCFSDARTGRAGTGYSHDTQCVVYKGPDTIYSGREICVSSNETALSVADVTDASSPIRVSKASYPAAAYVHQGWFTEDQRYFIQNDELDERAFGGTTRTMIWNLEKLDEPILSNVFTSPIASVDHNLYVRDGFAYQANYTSGLRVLDVRDPENPDVVGWFDTTPGNDLVSFSGTWTAYPFPNSKLVLLTSRGEGMFLVEPDHLMGTRFESVSSSINEGAVSFSWMMKNENDVARFVVEKKDIAGLFSPLAEVTAGGGDAQNKSYQTSFELDEGVYQLRVSAYSAEQERISSEEVTVVSMNGRFILLPVYPNPLVGTAYTSLAVESSQKVTVSVFDVAGKQVATLFDSVLNEGIELPLSFDSSGLPGGIYFLRVTGETFTATKEMVVVR
jgi:choice-of-anchor B domain-containing protein